MPVAGLLLTGGSSRRMGSPKAAIVVDGRPLAVWIADALSAVAPLALEVGPGYTDLPAVADAGVGPLGAMAAGWQALLDAGSAGSALVIACDLPMVDVPILRLIAGRPGGGTVIPVAGGRAQTLCARWSASALARSVDLVAVGERRMDALLSDGEDVEWLDESVWGPTGGAHALDDADTPERLTELLALRVQLDRG